MNILRKICIFLKLALLLPINKQPMQFVLVDIADREKFYPFLEIFMLVLFWAQRCLIPQVVSEFSQDGL